MRAAVWMARAVAGMVVSKPTPKNTRCFSGVCPGQFHRIQGGVNHPHLGPLGPQALQGGVGAGDPEHVAEGDQDHARFGPQGQEGVQVGLVGDAHRAAGAGNERQPLGAKGI